MLAPLEPLSSLQNLDKDLSFTDQFFMEKTQEEELGKTNAEAEVQSMVSVPIHQDTSLVPPMTTPVIDLTTMQSDYLLPKSTSLELDYLNQRLADQEEARKKRRKRRDVPRTPPGSPPSQPPPLPPPAGTSHTLGNKASSSSKTAASASQSMAWTTSDTRYESAGVFGTHKLSPNDSLMQDDSIPEEHVHLPATLEPTWTIPSSNKSNVANNWVSVLATTYEHPAENSLLAKTGDMMTFLKWYCRQVNKTTLTQADFEGHAYEVVKAFYPDVVYLQLQVEECHKMITNQIDWTNPEGDQVRVDVNQPLPLGGPPGHVTI
ncbi:hypothetical protein Tco_0889726 [Tanacetum coccineum]